MYEVIIERPRGGGRWARGTDGRGRMRDRLDPEQAALREPISMHRGGSKYLNENLAPLRRFLLSRVGRRWDEVFSEICATLRPDSAVQKHVLDHLRDMVYTRVVERDGTLFEHGRWGVRELDDVWRRWAVYVCPDTGVLKKVPRRPKVVPPAPTDVVPIDAGAQYRRIDGIWYHVTLTPVPEAIAYWDRTYDVVLGRYLRDLGAPWTREARLREHYGRGDRYASAKRQIGKRELRRLPLEVRG